MPSFPLAVALAAWIFWTIGSQSPYGWFLAGAGIVGVGVASKLVPWLNARRERRRLLEQCDLQHAAVLARERMVNEAVPSSQGPCICPEDGVMRDCPRHAFMWDWVGANPFKDHLRELRGPK